MRQWGLKVLWDCTLQVQVFPSYCVLGTHLGLENLIVKQDKTGFPCPHRTCRVKSTFLNPLKAFYLHICIISLEKESKGFPSCVFILLLRGPWCPLRLLVQWNQTDEMGAGHSAIFLGLSVAHQIWGWSLHTYVACLWGSWQFLQPGDHGWFQTCQRDRASSSWLETWQGLWSVVW